jgi:hypothetical protein
MRHRQVAIGDGSCAANDAVSPLATLMAQHRASIELEPGPAAPPSYALHMNRSYRSAPRPVAKPTEKDVHRQPRKRSLNMILSSILLTFIIAGALTFAAVRLLHSKSTGSKEGMPSEVVSASPVMVGTDHPVPANPTPTPTTSAKHKSPNPVTAPAPRPSAVVENDSRRELEPPSEAVREKAEQARDEAERKRAHVEDLFQNHLISEDAYKKGQAEYQREIAKYQDHIGKYHRTVTGEQSD